MPLFPRRLLPCLAAALFLLLLSGAARAQDAGSSSDAHSKTPGISRYDLIQSAQGGTWRFDRICGTVDQLVPGKGDGLTWKRTGPIPYACIIDRPHFELSVSGASPPQVLLMNVDFGDTWVLRPVPNPPRDTPDTAWVAFDK